MHCRTKRKVTQIKQLEVFWISSAFQHQAAWVDFSFAHFKIKQWTKDIKTSQKKFADNQMEIEKRFLNASAVHGAQFFYK